MSFSSDTKYELSKLELNNQSHKYAELYGMLLFSSKFSAREILFKTENRYTAVLFEQLLRDLFNPIIEKQSDLRPSVSSGLYKIILPVPDECKTIYEYFGHTQYDINLKNHMLH